MCRKPQFHVTGMIGKDKQGRERFGETWTKDNEPRSERSGREGGVMSEGCKESRRQRQTAEERPWVSSFLLVIGFSDWSKLFFSILLVSLSLSSEPPHSMAWKIKRTGPTVWLALVHSSGLLKPIFQLTEQRKTGKDGQRVRETEGLGGELKGEVSLGVHREALAMWIRVNV